MLKLVYDQLFTPDYDCIRSSAVAIVSYQLSIVCRL